jgi:L-ascorbate metabolism protein UlaG (beta-lactamase superfamily)
MDYEGNRTPEMKALRTHITEKRGKSIEMAEAIRALDALLKKHPKGYSLEPLYAKVPELLKGYVELVYDLNSNPSFRFFEKLLYASDYYQPEAQSIALWLTHNNERPFCLSTPRLDEPHVLHVDVPFSHEGIDALSRMKREGGSYESIKRALNVGPADEPLFESFFTQEAPPRYERYQGDKIRMRYFGHACILVETRDVSILVDPLISYYGYHSDVVHFSDADLPDEIDYVLITHNHQDHILFETLLALRHKVKNIIVPRTGSSSLQDPNLKLMFNRIGFNNVLEIDEMEAITFNGCTITGIPFTGEHCDLNVRTKICFHVAFSGFSLLFVADSRVMEPRLYAHVHKLLGDVDVIFLGMECDGAPLTWLYGPLLTEELGKDKDNSRRLAGSDFEKGMSLVEIFHPKETYVYAMGLEPWLEFISSVRFNELANPIIQSNKLIKACNGMGIVAERLYGEKELLYSKKNAPVMQPETL